jgi:hypothetical protein
MAGFGPSADIFSGLVVLFAIAFVAVFAIILAVWAIVLWRGFRGVEDQAVTEL